MRIITDPSTRRTSAVEVDAAELGKSLTLFKERYRALRTHLLCVIFGFSILIMDEVDLILHPMKSELNFPIGEKIELDFSPQRWQMPIHLLDSIFYAERQRISVSFKQVITVGFSTFFLVTFFAEQSCQANSGKYQGGN